MHEDSLIHIDWVDLDNIIIISSKDSHHKRFLESIKDKSKKARIIKLVTNQDINYDKILVIENKFFHYIDYQKKSNDYYIKLVTEINSDVFIKIYKEFNREIILNEILKK
jgi:hypothetical protein